MPIDDSVMEIVPNSVPQPIKKQVDVYSNNEFRQMLANIRKGSGTNDPIKFDSEFFQSQRKIRDDLQGNMKILNLLIKCQRNPESVTSRLRDDEYLQKILYFNKRFKGIFRHAYQTIEDTIADGGPHFERLRDLRKGIESEISDLNKYK